MEEIAAKTIITRTKGSGWFGTSYNMNIYRGCNHGCIYCDSRSDCYGTQEFDRVRMKKDALRIIRDDLRRKVKPGVVGTGAMSDPYNPFEKDQKLTRHALELLNAYGFGVAIATKSDLVTRDLDVLQEIKEQSPVLVKVTVTTADDELARKIEPYAPSSSVRLGAVEALAKQGLFTGLLLMPVLPFVTDTPESIRGVVKAAADSGARFVYPSLGVTLRQNQRDYFLEKIDQLFPGLGARYIAQYGTHYHCASPRARQLWDVFRDACGQHGLLYKMPEIISAYKQGYGDSQLTWFTSKDS